MLCKSIARARGIRWWGWALIILWFPMLALLLWLWLHRRTKEETVPVARIEITAPSFAVGTIEEAVPVAEPASPTPDDLKCIEGIGPKISGVFHATGITTFAQLAATDAGQLKRILRESGIRIADPSTWPEQAGLAAAGEWDALEALQAELKGGRRV